MTTRQAHKEAVKRWGKSALVEDKGPRDPIPHPLWRRFCVGKNMMGLFFEVRGDSNLSFEDAFAQVDKREASQKARWAQLAKKGEDK